MIKVFNLIKAMSPAEKKYFRRFGLKDTSKEDNQTKQLFELLDEQTEFDLDKVTNRLKRLGLDKKAAHTSEYLYALLTENMVWYHRHRFIELSSAFDFAQIQLLDEKGQQSDSQKMFEKLREEVLVRGTFTEKWKVLSHSIHESTNLFMSSKKSVNYEVDNYIKQREELLQQMQRFHEYDALLFKQLNLIRGAMQARSKEDLNALNEIFSDPLIKKIESANSPESQYTFHTIRLQHFITTQQLKNALQEAEMLVAFVEGTRSASVSVLRKLWALAQLSQSYYFNADWEKLSLALEKIKNVETRSTTEDAAKFSYYTQLAIPMLDHKGEKENLIVLLQDAANQLRQFKAELRTDIRLGITVTCASAFLEYEMYGDAIDVCEHFLSHYNSGIRLDAMFMLYTFQTIAHLEMSNAVYVNNILQNIERYFTKNEFREELENLMLKTMKKLSTYGAAKIAFTEANKMIADLQAAGATASATTKGALLPVLVRYIEKHSVSS